MTKFRSVFFRNEKKTRVWDSEKKKEKKKGVFPEGRVTQPQKTHKKNRTLLYLGNTKY